MLTRRSALLSVLALGACDGLAATETRAPATGAPNGLRLSAPRAVHGLVRMADGSVLFIGGCVAHSCETGPASATVDRYDPTSGAVRRVGRLTGVRTSGAAVVLADQTVLVAGGWAGRSLTAGVELFDPRSGTSSVVGNLASPQGCSATLLPDGGALLIGGDSVEVYDPARRRLQRLGVAPRQNDRGTATLLADGRMLLVGGGVPSPTAAAHLLDPKTGVSTPTGGLTAPRYKHAAVRLADGRVLVVGGSDGRDRAGKTRALEVYDPGTGRFTKVGETLQARFKITDAVVVLSSGRVLVIGGAERPELIDPHDWSARPVDFALGAPLNFATATALTNGDVLVAGGYDERTIDPTDRVWIIPRATLV